MLLLTQRLNHFYRFLFNYSILLKVLQLEQQSAQDRRLLESSPESYRVYEDFDEPDG